MPIQPPLYSVTIAGENSAGEPTAVSVDDDGNIVLTADLDIDTTGLATSAKQDTLIGHVDGVEAAVAATNTAVAATNTALSDGTQKVKTSLPTGAHAGANLATSSSSAAFASQATTIGLAVFNALAANTAPVYIARATGVTTGTGIELSPGEKITLPCANTNEYFAISAAAQNVRALAL